MSETPAKKAIDDDVGGGESTDAANADTDRPSPAPDEQKPVDETLTEPGAKDAPKVASSAPPPTPPPSTEESSAPRVVPRISVPRASPPRARPLSTRPAAITSPATPGPRIAGTRTVKLPTPEVVSARLEEPPSTEPSFTDADGTAATRPFEVDDTTATMQAARRAAGRDDEEDGPTLIAGYPSGSATAPPSSLPASHPGASRPSASAELRAHRDDEATLVQPMARPGSQPSIDPLFGEPRPEYSKTSELDIEPSSLRPSPPPIPPSPSIISHGALSQRLAERELAVQAALAAASGLAEDEVARAARRNRQATTAAMVLLGGGMVLGALYGYLSSHALADDGSAARSASYASLTVLTTIALFFAGTAPLQRSTELKVALVVMSGLVLLFTMVRMLTIAFG